MRNIQEVFNAIQDKKKEIREIKKMYRDALESSGEYRELNEKLEELKIHKKQLEAVAWSDIGNKNSYETSKLDIKQDREMLTDLAMNTLMSGETVKIVDQDNNEYEPKFSLSFKKVNVVSQANSN
jgi:predicted nuclease with TOPRIM domain